MPMLDVSFMLDDAMLNDVFNVQRTLNIVGSDGRLTRENDELFEKVEGVVTQQDPADLIRTEDGMSVPKRIFVASRFQFISETPANQPDLIFWNKVWYSVVQVFPYSRYGDGFYEVIAEFRGPVPPLQ